VAAGIPVIVWKESAFKDFVEKNNIGISVSCIKEIDERLANISNEDYRLMIENTRKISKRTKKRWRIFSNIVDRLIQENKD
jgi:IS4 transposase